MKITHTPYRMGCLTWVWGGKVSSREEPSTFPWSRDSVCFISFPYRCLFQIVKNPFFLFSFLTSPITQMRVCLDESEAEWLSVMTLSEIHLLLVLLVFPSRLLVFQTVSFWKCSLLYLPVHALNIHHRCQQYFPGIIYSPLFTCWDTLEGLLNLFQTPVQVFIFSTLLTIDRKSECVWWFRYIVYLCSQLLRFFQKLT